MLVTNFGKGKSRRVSFPTTEMTVKLKDALEYGDPVVGYYSSMDIVTNDKIPNPATLPTNTPYTCSWSPNGRYLVVGHAAPFYLTIYDWQSGSPVKIADPATLPTGYAYACSWSLDGRYLAIAHNDSPFITIYDWQSGSPVKIANPATLPGDTGYACSWSPNGRYLVVGQFSPPYITIYDWQSGSPVKMANPAVLPNGAGKDCSWSPNGRYLAVAHTYSPRITIYDWQSGSPVKIADPATLPTEEAGACSWSPDGRYLAVGHMTSPRITIYDWQSGSPVKIADPAVLPPATGNGSSWSSNGRYLSVAHWTAPFITTYDWQSGSPVKVANPEILPTGTGRGCSWSPDGRYLAVAHEVSPYITIYEWIRKDQETHIRKFKNTPDKVLIDTLSEYGQVAGLGYSRKAHASGDTVTFDLIRFGSENWAFVKYGNVYDLSATPGLENIRLFWKDPEDAVGATKTVKWSGTLVVRKLGGYPVDETDGSIVLNSVSRDAYSNNGFLDTGLSKDTTYYYRLFPYFEDETVVRNSLNDVSAMAQGDPPASITNLTITAGPRQASIAWTDPASANWANTKIVRKTGSYPASLTDGTIVLTTTIRNQYAGVAYVDSGLTGGTTYWYRAFPISISGVIGSGNYISIVAEKMLEKFTGSLSTLSGPRNQLAAVSFNNRALFGGGVYGDYKTEVDAFDSALTRTSLPPLTKGRCTLAATYNESYAIFAGGADGSSSLNTVDAYNVSFSKSTPTVLTTARSNLSGTMVVGYALFAGGSSYNASTGNSYYATVDAYNTSLTRSTPSSGLSTARNLMGSASIGNAYALFAGGLYQYVENQTSYAYWRDNVDHYNMYLVRGSSSTLSAMRSSLVGVSGPSFAAFAGGVRDVNVYQNTVDHYNGSLTRSTATNLSVARSFLAGVYIDGYTIFAGGRASTNVDVVDVYNSSFVRSTSAHLSTARNMLSGAAVGSYAIFAGGYTTNSSAATDAYISS